MEINIHLEYSTQYVPIYKTVILTVILYGCETWSVVPREEHTVRVFEDRFLRRIFGPKRNEVLGEWKKLHNEKLHRLYSSPDIKRQMKSRHMKRAGHVAHMGEKRKLYIKGFGGKARRKETTRKTKV
jgi:hypothetical protein